MSAKPLCESCKGLGCVQCGGTGHVEAPQSYRDRLRANALAAPFSKDVTLLEANFHQDQLLFPEGPAVDVIHVGSVMIYGQFERLPGLQERLQSVLAEYQKQIPSSLAAPCESTPTHSTP